MGSEDSHRYSTSTSATPCTDSIFNKADGPVFNCTLPNKDSDYGKVTLEQLKKAYTQKAAEVSEFERIKKMMMEQSRFGPYTQAQSKPALPKPQRGSPFVIPPASGNAFMGYEIVLQEWGSQLKFIIEYVGQELIIGALASPNEFSGEIELEERTFSRNRAWHLVSKPDCKKTQTPAYDDHQEACTTLRGALRKPHYQQDRPSNVLAGLETKQYYGGNEDI